MRSFLSLLIISVCIANSLHGADWPAFRGSPLSLERGHAEGSNYPTEWSATNNISWRFRLPAGGNSSPVVANNRVYVTCANMAGDERHLFCLDAETGAELWKNTVSYQDEEPTHKTNPHCASSPATDGEHVVVWHGSAGIYCYSKDGSELWNYQTGPIHHIWGTGSSPIIYNGLVFLNIGPGKETYLLALNLRTGEVAWKTAEAGGNFGESSEGKKLNWIGSWSTPQVATIEGIPQVVCAMPTRVIGYHAGTGKILWYCSGLENLPRSNLVYTDPILTESYAVTLGGFKGPGIGFRPGGSGDITGTAREWRIVRDNPQRIGSGVIVGEHLYAPSAGINGIQCLEIKSGKVLWTERTPAPFWGSMILAGELIYVTDQSGTTWVIHPSPREFQLVAKNKMGERSNSTPAFVEGSIFLRTFNAVYKIVN